MQEALKNNFGDYVKKRIDSGMIYVSESAGSVVGQVFLSGRSGIAYRHYPAFGGKI